MTTAVEGSGRPGWSLNGEQTLAELDALHDVQTRLSARRLELLRHLDDLGHAKDLGARDTIELISLRHRLDRQTVRRDLRTAKALPGYPVICAQLPGATHPAPAATDPDHTPADTMTADQTTDQATDGPTDAPVDGSADGSADGLASLVDARRRATVRDTVLNPAQVAVITQILDQAPPTTRPVDLAVAETELVIAARTLLPRDLRRLGPGVLNALDPDGPEPTDPANPDPDAVDPVEVAHAAQTLWYAPGRMVDPTGTGIRVQGLRLGGFLTGEHAELLQVLVDAAAKPRKTPAGELDPRTLGQRRADAFCTILRAAASTNGHIPAHGGIKPHLSVTIPYTALTTALNGTALNGTALNGTALNGTALASANTGPGRTTADGATADGATADGATPDSPAPDSPGLDSAAPGSMAPGNPVPGSPVPGSPVPGSPVPASAVPDGQVPASPMPGSGAPGGAVLGSGLVLPTTFIGTADGGGISVGGNLGGISVGGNLGGISVGGNLGGVGGQLIFGEPLPVSEVRRIACDAGIIPIILGSNGEPLDVGREQRLVTPAIRRALIARDGGCVIPGCDAPPGHCDAHHLQAWADGGITSLDNTVLACTPDHRSIHRGTWHITIVNGLVHVTRPTWTEPGTPHPRN